MNRKLPLAITFLAGLVVIIADFIPHRPFGSILKEQEAWFMIVSAFAIILGTLSLFHVNLIKIQRRSPNWQYHILALAGFIVMVVVGFLWGTDQTPGMLGHGTSIQSTLSAKPFDYLFTHFYQHLSATMFSLLAFFIASAAYRAFIARTTESVLLLIAAVLVMLGRTSIGYFITGGLPEHLSFLRLESVSEFVANYLTRAGQRAILISAGLGVVGSSLRILLGIERSYLGGDR